MLKKILILTSTILLTSCFENNSKLGFNTTEVHFNESATKEVLQDTFISTLSFQAQGSDVVSLQNEVNEKMDLALKNAKSNKDLKVKTGNYSVNRNWDALSKKYSGFNATQQIIIESKNKEVLLEVTGKIQQLGFTTNSLSAFLSEETKASFTDELVVEALNRVKDRAQMIAKNLGKTEVKIATININSNSPRQPPIFSKSSRTMSLESGFNKPAVEAGEQKISVSISVIAHLED